MRHVLYTFSLDSPYFILHTWSWMSDAYPAQQGEGKRLSARGTRARRVAGGRGVAGITCSAVYWSTHRVPDGCSVVRIAKSESAPHLHSLYFIIYTLYFAKSESAPHVHSYYCALHWLGIRCNLVIQRTEDSHMNGRRIEDNGWRTMYTICSMVHGARCTMYGDCKTGVCWPASIKHKA